MLSSKSGEKLLLLCNKVLRLEVNKTKQLYPGVVILPDLMSPPVDVQFRCFDIW